MRRKKAASRLFAVMLALVMVLGLFPVSVLANTGSSITVYVSLEGYNLGHGFYIEPMRLVLPAGSTAADATMGLLNHSGYRAGGGGFLWDEAGGRNVLNDGEAFYLARVYGINRNYVNPPGYVNDLLEYLDVGLNLNHAVAGGALSEFHFTQWSGWMLTADHVIIPVGAEELYLQGGEVLRWQFSLVGLGADLGVDFNWEELVELGASPPLYEHADKSNLVRGLFMDGLPRAARLEALDVAINPLATAQEVADALAMLHSAVSEQIAVYISLEGYNLGHGFYIEPTRVTVPVNSNGMEATSALLAREGLNYSVTWGLDRIQNIHPGTPVVFPSYITISPGAGSGDGSVGSGDYSPDSGWVVSVDHRMLEVGLDAHTLTDGEVIRWQFSVEGWGADLGLGIAQGFWTDALYTHADKTELFRALAASDAGDERQAAIAVAINPLATAQEVADVLEALLSGAEPVEWLGEGTASAPFLIGNEAQLTLLAERVNTGFTPAGSNIHFRLSEDITLDADWVPIGIPGTAAANVFGGTFDGGGHTITFAHGSGALFGAVRLGTVIRNLNISGPYIADNGLISGVGPTMDTGVAPVVIDNVTILSGTTIRRSGFAGEDGDRVLILNISNSTVESGVRIGWSAHYNAPFDQSIGYNREGFGAGPGIGSFVSGLVGSVTNSVSYARVYGQDNVGGLVGYKAQAARPFNVVDSRFSGTIVATGDFVGGLVGAGYAHDTGVNTPGVNIRDSIVTGSVTGRDNVGGIFGGERLQVQAWSNGIGTIENNRFEGNLSANPGALNVGGIIGYMHSLNRHNIIRDNVFAAESGANRGIGGVWIVDTIHQNPVDIPGTFYFNTAIPTGELAALRASLTAATGVNFGTPGLTVVNLYRTDDPLGADARALARVYLEEIIQVPYAQAAAAVLEAHTFVPVVQAWVGAVATTRTAAIEAVRTQVNALLEPMNVTAVIPAPALAAFPNPTAAGVAPTDRVFTVNITGSDSSTATATVTVNIEFLQAPPTGVNVTQPGGIANIIAGSATTLQFNAAVLPAALPQNVVWSVTELPGVSISQTGLLNVGASVPLGTEIIISATVAGGEVFGTTTVRLVEAITVYMSFEGYSIGHGFFIEPVRLTVPRGSTVAVATSQLLNQRGHTYTATGTRPAFNLTRVFNFNAVTATVPAELEAIIRATSRWGNTWDMMFTSTGSANGSLGANDFYMFMSGWMYFVNHYSPVIGAGAYTLGDGDVVRWKFTMLAGPDIGFTMDESFSGPPLFEHVDRTELIRAMSVAGVSGSARQAALDVVINYMATLADVNEALAYVMHGTRPPAPVDRVGLNEAIAEALALVPRQDEFTVQSWDRMQAALTLALDTRDDQNATQSVVNMMTNNLRAALNNLALIPMPPVVDRDMLNEAISEAQALAPRQAEFTTQSWDRMQAALTLALDARDNINATQSVVNIMANNLRAALNNLVEDQVEAEAEESDYTEDGVQEIEMSYENIILA